MLSPWHGWGFGYSWCDCTVTLGASCCWACEWCRPLLCRAELALPGACALPKQWLVLQQQPEQWWGWRSSSWVPCSVLPGPTGGQQLAIMGSSAGGHSQCISPRPGHPQACHRVGGPGEPPLPLHWPGGLHAGREICETHVCNEWLSIRCQDF